MAVAQRKSPELHIEYKEMPLSELYIDHANQRSLNLSWVEYLSENWWEPAAGTMIISDRGPNVAPDRRYPVLFGQHRLHARRKLGHSTAWCQVVTGLNSDEEARVFVETA